MSRFIKSNEAERAGFERCWAHIEQFNPRRGTLRGHIITVVVTLVVVAVFLTVERSAQWAS